MWIAVAVGGALGSMARHAVNHLARAHLGPSRFPAGTAAVNLIGCFAIGVLAGLIASDRLTLRMAWREFVFVGLLGGFTTFSTFGLDTFVLIRSHAGATALVYAAVQVIGGLLAVWIGYAVASAGR